MKKAVRWMIWTAALVGLAGAIPAAESQVVFVSMERTFAEFYKTKLADEQLKKQAEEFNTERKKLTTDLEKFQEEFNVLREESQDVALSEDARAQKRNAAEEKLVELRDMETRIRRFDEARQKQLDDQSRRMRKRIVEEIRATIQTYARTQGYRAVLDSSAMSLNGVETLLYTDVKGDITDAVIEMLNKTKDTAVVE